MCNKNLPCYRFSNEDSLCRSKERIKMELNAKAWKMETVSGKDEDEDGIDLK